MYHRLFSIFRLLLFICTLLIFYNPDPGFAQGAGDAKPNILIYVADDQYKSSIGSYGAEPSHTPNIDKLAEEGIRFTHCFTPSSICTPNRGVLLSGMYPLKNGAHPNHSGFYDGIKSLPNYMKELGYRACIVGKDGIQKPSDLYEWEFRIKKSDEHVPGADEPKHDRHRKTRFDKVEKFIGDDDPRPFCIFHAASLPHSPLYIFIHDSSLLLRSDLFDQGMFRRQHHESRAPQRVWPCGKNLHRVAMLGMENHRGALRPANPIGL